MNDVASATTTPATAALLWSACRPEPDLAGVRAAVADGADLRRAADAALVQRAAPLLWRALEAAELDLPDADWLADLRDDAALCRAQAMMLLPRFAQSALVPLADAGLEPLVVKGAALAERYPAPGLRPMSDVDVVLPAAQHQAAVDALTSAGWERVSVPGRHDDSSGLVHPGVPGLPIDLHRSLGPWRERGGGPTGEWLWRRRRPTTIAGVAAFGLDVEDELAMLVAHAGKPFHCFSRIVWMSDLLVVAAGRVIDWDRVARDAARGGYSTVLGVALIQGARLGLDSPVHLRTPRARGLRARALEPILSDDWPLTGRTGSDELFRYILVDRTSRRVALFVGDATRDGVMQTPARVAASARRAFGRWKRMRSAGGEDLGSALPR